MLLAIAQALLAERTQKPLRTTATTHYPHSDGELLTVADVAAMTRLSVGTQRYWTHRSQWAARQAGTANSIPPQRSRDLAEGRALTKFDP